MNHFLHECAHIAVDSIASLNRYATIDEDAKNPMRYWRDTARRLECRWRERTHKMRHTIEEPQNPADACDDIFAEKVDDAAMQQTPPDDIRFYLKAA